MVSRRGSRHGLLRPSFIPPASIRVLRDLTRYRKTLVELRTQEINRVHKVLETANIKLGAVGSRRGRGQWATHARGHPAGRV
jgi:transposase